VATHLLSAVIHTLREHSNNQDVANTRREETTTIHATVSAVATGGCSYAPHRRTWRTKKKTKRGEKENGGKTKNQTRRKIRIPIWSTERVGLRTPWTEYGCPRRQYGESTEPVRTDYPQHRQHTWNMKLLSKLGCGLRRIGAEIHRHSTHTVRIPRGSRRIEHPPWSAASVRRCERGFRHTKT